MRLVLIERGEGRILDVELFRLTGDSGLLRGTWLEDDEEEVEEVDAA